jgi:hypothetical protein
MPRTIERLRNPLFLGPITLPKSASANPTGGLTTIASGSASVVISTTWVKSDSLIVAMAQSPTNAASGFSRGLEVKSVVDSTSFIIGTPDNQPLRAADTSVAWALIRYQ